MWSKVVAVTIFPHFFPRLQINFEKSAKFFLMAEGDGCGPNFTEIVQPVKL